MPRGRVATPIVVVIVDGTPTEAKRCSICSEVKPLSLYSFIKSSGKFFAQCKPCKNKMYIAFAKEHYKSVKREDREKAEAILRKHDELKKVKP